MKKYFYTDGSNKFGPFTMEELKEKGITRETQIWFEGLSNWQSAGSIHELNEVFKLTPPPIQKPNLNNYSNTINNYIPPKTWLVESILATLFCCLPVGIVGIINAAKVESRFNSGDVAGARSASDEAKKWTMISFWIGLAVAIIYILVIAVGAFNRY